MVQVFILVRATTNPSFNLLQCLLAVIHGQQRKVSAVSEFIHQILKNQERRWWRAYKSASLDPLLLTAAADSERNLHSKDGVSQQSTCGNKTYIFRKKN